MARATGLASADAENDFLRTRRARSLTRLASRLRGEPDDINDILSFGEVVEALGRVNERAIGQQSVELASIVGSVDRTRDFDRRFRPTSTRVRARWERLNTAQRQGAAMPPIDLYRIGDMHFVRDGHHRVSVAFALGYKQIDALVIEVTTRLPVTGVSHRHDLVTKDLERIFMLRVPLRPGWHAQLEVRDPWRYAELGEAVEAWGMRLMQAQHDYLDRAEVAHRWWTEEYEPVVAMLHDADLIGGRSDVDAYLAVACDRYRLLRTHDWTPEIIDRLRRARPGDVSADRNSAATGVKSRMWSPRR